MAYLRWYRTGVVIFMKDLKVLFLHPGLESVEALRGVLDFDERKYGLNFIWDDNRPDYIIADQMVYYDKSLFRQFKRYQKVAGGGYSYNFFCRRMHLT